jgi:hypothetical protein
MERRFNLKLINGLLWACFLALVAIALIIDIPAEMGAITGGTFVIWYLSSMFPEKTIAAIVAAGTAVVFLAVAVRYNRIRRAKVDKYLASMIFFSAVYQVLARALEASYIVSESDLHDIVYTCMKFYLPLDILSVLVFALVAFEVFLRPVMGEGKNNRLDRTLMVVGIAATAFGIVISTFSLYPKSILTFKIVVSIGGMALYFVIVVLVALTSYRIFTVWARNRQATAILAIAIQLILATAALLFFIIVEGSAVLPLTMAQLYILRTIKDLLFLGTAVLMYPAFIRPARQETVQV